MQGPSLIRTVTQDGGTLALTGDWSSATQLEIFAPASFDMVLFNNALIDVQKTPYGSLLGNIPASECTAESVAAQLPSLTNWKVQDGLPERNPEYDDSKWTGMKTHLNFDFQC